MKIRLMVKGQSLGLGDEIGLFEWKGSTCMIGRRDCELNLSDAYCSHRHALLYQGPRGELRLRDLESTNGTWIGGRKAEDTEIRIGDEIRIGKTLFHIISFRPSAMASSTDTAIREAREKVRGPDHTNITRTRPMSGERTNPFVRIRKATVA